MTGISETGSVGILAVTVQLSWWQPWDVRKAGNAFEVASAWLLLSLCGLSLENIVESFSPFESLF